MFCQHVKYKITSDKTGTAGYDNVNKNASSRKIWLENVVYSLNLHIYSPVFPHILLYIQKLPSTEQQPYLDRMWQVRLKGNEIGGGVWDDFEQAWEVAGLPERE